MHDIVAANVGRWDKVAVRVNPLFVASATRYVCVFRVAKFCHSEKQDLHTLVVHFQAWMLREILIIVQMDSPTTLQLNSETYEVAPCCTRVL